MQQTILIIYLRYLKNGTLLVSKTNFIIPQENKKPHNDYRCKALANVPGRIRTCDPQLRRLLLYPAELLGHGAGEGN